MSPAKRNPGNRIVGSGAANGNVFGITNYKDTARSQTITYDALNRLRWPWMGGTATFVSGVTDIMGAATNTNVKEADKGSD